MAGVPGCTVNALDKETTSLPVVTVTGRGPGVAPTFTVIGTDRSKGPLTVGVPAETPVPTFTMLPAMKCVN